MSSIYREKYESEAKEELNRLLDKKSTYGWTQKDADRYSCLIRELED